MPIEIEMVTNDSKPIDNKQIDIKAEADEPEIVIWGERYFQRTTEHKTTDHTTGITTAQPTTYREVFPHKMPPD